MLGLVSKKKYNKLKKEYDKLKYNIGFHRINIDLVSENKKLRKQCEEMKEQKQFGDIIEVELRKELERVNKQLEYIYENSFNYDELMSLMHEDYTKQQGLEMIKTFIDNNGL